jgi:hypothetical protein
MSYLLPSVTATVHPAAEREDTKTINGKTIHLLAYGWSTRRSWGHTAYCPELGLTNKIRYYNRTWEAHRFDSVIHGLLYKCRMQLDGDFRKAENKAVRERRKARREAAKREAEERQQVLNLGI